MQLTLFTDRTVLRNFDRPILVRFLEDFKPSLPPEASALLTGPSDFEQFCAACAALFGNASALGAPLLDALFAIETLARPENRSLLEDALSRLPSGFDVNRSRPPVFQALHLWIIATNTPGLTFPLPLKVQGSSSSAESPTPSQIQNRPPPAPLPPPTGEDRGLDRGPSRHSVRATVDEGNSAPPHSEPAGGGTADQLPIETSDQSKIENHHSKLDGDGSPATTPHAPAPTSHQSLNPPASPAAAILDTIVQTAQRFVVLPKWVPEAVALFVFHTYAWELRDITTFLGIESPQHRCGKSTLLAVLRRLVNRPEGAAHISSPAVFRTISKGKCTLLVDETDKVLRKNQLLCGILNASYSRELAYVIRVVPRSKKHAPNGAPTQPEYIPIDAPATDPATEVAPSPIENQNSKIENPSDSDVARFSCWCPKAMAQIGHFNEILADRCIIITMQRKTPAEKCERIRNLKDAEAAAIHRQCADFVRQHRDAIANAEPTIPDGLNDRAADIWEPLFVLADLAGGHWPQKARLAALALSGAGQTTNLISSLLLDCLVLFTEFKTQRMFTRDLVHHLNALPARPWRELAKAKPIDDLWLAKQLRPFAIQPTTIWIGQQAARGYLQDAFLEPARRYTSKADWEFYKAAFLQPEPPPTLPPPPTPPPPATDPTAPS